MPLFAVLRLPKWRMGYTLGLIMAIVGAVVPAMTNAMLPVPLRMAHGVEMVEDGFVQGLMMAWLLWVKK